MNPQDPLANLHPLRQPDLIGWWPLAPGWWVLLTVILVSLAALAYVLIRRYRANAYRRRALAQLQALHQQYLAEDNASRFLAQTNALLKSVAIRAYSRRDVAARHGRDWLLFLNSRGNNAEQFQAEFATAAYRANCPQMDMEQVYRAAQAWIKRHEVAP